MRLYTQSSLSLKICAILRIFRIMDLVTRFWRVTIAHITAWLFMRVITHIVASFLRGIIAPIIEWRLWRVIRAITQVILRIVIAALVTRILRLVIVHLTGAFSAPLFQ